MSLINQVLQDLDARQRESGKEIRLPNDVRPLPVRRESSRPIVLSLLVLLALCIGVVVSPWGGWLQDMVLGPGVATVAPVSAPPVSAAKPDTLPAVSQEKAAQPSEEALSQQAKEILPEPDFESSLRMSDAISLPEDNRGETKITTRQRPEAMPPMSAGRSVAAAKKIPAELGKNEFPAQVRSEALERLAVPVSARSAIKRDGTPTIERTEALGSPRERAEAEYRKVISAINLGRMTEALEGLRTALRHDGLHVASRQLLVKLLLESKQHDEAIRVLQDGLQELPAQIGWAMSLARLQMDRGDLSGAWLTLNQSLPAAGDNADYQGFAGHILQRLGQNREAAERYAAAARLVPGDGRWWLGLGLAQEAEGRSIEAREAFLRAKQCGNLSPELAGLAEQKLR